MAAKLQALWNHPSGPKTIFFWAPTIKWGLTIANIADLEKPPQDISYPTQAAMVVSGVIWSRYSTIITPKSMPLLSVSLGMAATGAYQLMRKFRHDQSMEKEESSISIAA